MWPSGPIAATTTPSLTMTGCAWVAGRAGSTTVPARRLVPAKLRHRNGSSRSIILAVFRKDCGTPAFHRPRSTRSHTETGYGSTAKCSPASGPEERYMNEAKFYIDGQWVDPVEPRFIHVIDPATEEAFARIAVGSAEDVDRAVASSRRAFPTHAAMSVADRIELLHAIVEGFDARREELGSVISREMDAPLNFALSAQVASGPNHLNEMIRVLQQFAFDERRGTTLITREPIGVSGLITPWSWPINQIVCKVAPALAAGCTMVLKPCEIAPLSALIFAQILHDAGVPAGVFNLVNGDGPSVGAAISAHPDVDMVSFTGSTRAGVLVAKAAADSVKRVAQELGGKSPNILLPDADFARSVDLGVARCFGNSGQSCSAATRMLV